MRPEVEHGPAAFDVPTDKGVPVACLQIDAVDPCDWVAVALRTIDVDSDEGAGIHPVGCGCIRDQVACPIDCLGKASELQIHERPTGIVAGAVDGHARLILVAQEVHALKTDLLRAIGVESRRRAGGSRGVDGHVVHLEAHCVLGASGVANLHSVARTCVEKNSPTLRSAGVAGAAKGAAVEDHVTHAYRHDDLISRRDRCAGQIDHSIGN
jgi:hypothetical protein